MCGIVGLLVKKPSARAALGEMLAPMMVCMSERGPDSAGLAVFGDAVPGNGAGPRRFSLFSPDPGIDWNAVKTRFTNESAIPAEIQSIDNNAVLIAVCDPETFEAWLSSSCPSLHLLSVGKTIHMYKD